MKAILLITITFLYGTLCSQHRKITVQMNSKEPKTELKNTFIELQPLGLRQEVNSKKSLVFNLPVETKDASLILLSNGKRMDSLRITSDQVYYQFSIEPRSKDLEAVVISGVTKATQIRENPISIALVGTKSIDKATENNIVEALVKNVPGLQTVKTGPNISKPFIHGLGYNRVLTLYDGMRQEGQQYGDEHGLEVDDYIINKAEVIKGPASLLYGSDAIAGVISLFPYIPNRNDARIHGKTVSEYQTNNGLIGAGLRLDYSDNRWIFGWRSSYKMAQNYRNPVDGRVYLTNFDVSNFSLLAGLKSEKGYSHFNFTLFNNHQGIPDGSREAFSRKFTKQIAEEDNDDLETRPVVSDSELKSYRLPDLVQHIQHYRLYWHSNYDVGRGNVDFFVGGQQNVRKEFTHPSMPKLPGMNMKLNSLNYSFRYNLPEISKFDFSIGFNGMMQKNINQEATDFPIPNYHLQEMGVYWYGKWKWNKWNISGGLRYDIRQVKWNDFYVGIHPETGFTQQVTSPNSESELQFEAYNKKFNGISGSWGFTYQLSQSIALKANIARAYRAPSITEIGSNGLDPGAHIVYLGNRNFKPEFSFQEDLGIIINHKNISGELSFFNNSIQNYIYMAMVADASGNPLVDNQGNKTYQYQQSKAHLYGAEMSLALHPEKLKNLRWNNSFSLVYGFNKNKIYENKGTQGEFLPLIPPMKILSQLSYDFHVNRTFLSSIQPQIELEYNARQNRFLGLNGTETFTPDYTLVHIGFSADFYLFNVKMQGIFQVNNLFDRAYQSHLNRLKYFEHDSNSSSPYSGIYNMGRNICFKLIVGF